MSENADNQKQANEDRLRRAKSWCDRGLQMHNRDEDAFLFLWIAFNAAYGRASQRDKLESQKFGAFTNFITLKKKESLLKPKVDKIEHFLFGSGKMPLVIESLINNKFVFQPFWNAQSDGSIDWEDEFSSHTDTFKENWENRKMAAVLSDLLWRLYTLRNQMLHGNMTYGGSWGDQQMHDGALIMRILVPIIVDVFEIEFKENPETNFWGDVSYPRFSM